MDEYNRVIETNVLRPELNIDEETLFNPNVLINYIDDTGNHYLVGDSVSIIIPKSEWNIFLQNIKTIHYKNLAINSKLLLFSNIL